jgi:L-fuculose-phosphate aldolase
MLAQGLTTGTGGNISLRRGDRVAISPSGMAYNDIQPDDVPLVDLHGEPAAGKRTPSSERRMHTTIIRERDDANAVVHTHSPYASTFASLNRAIPASHYLIAFAGRQIPVAGYATYGTEDLAGLALDTLGDEYDACLLKQHGVIAVGATLEAAFERALMVEYCARIHYQTTNIGEPVLLPDDEVDRLRGVFEGYGQSAQDHAEAVAPAPEPDVLRDERQSIADLGVQMLEQDLTKGTGGNVSARNGDRVVINPSGVPYDEVSVDNVPIVDIHGEQVAGELKASTETPMHTEIYRQREEVGGVVHTHSPYATTFASLSEPIPASHYLIAFAGDQVPVAPYEKPASKALGRAAAEALGDDYNACLLENHGTISVGPTPEAAFEVALMIEYCARIEFQARGVGTSEILSDAEIAHLTDRFRNYGQSGGVN